MTSTTWDVLFMVPDLGQDQKIGQHLEVQKALLHHVCVIMKAGC